MTRDQTIRAALNHLDAAQALVRRFKINTTCLTLYWGEVYRRHIEATRGDAKREGVEPDAE